MSGDTKVAAGIADLYAAAWWEITKITDPKQRGALADILESLSDYNYLLGRTLIAELEFEAGMAKIMGEDISAKSLPLVRPTMGQAFGWVGGLKIRNDAGVTDPTPFARRCLTPSSTH